jgi:hypothetical protein
MKTGMNEYLALSDKPNKTKDDNIKLDKWTDSIIDKFENFKTYSERQMEKLNKNVT